LLILASAGVLNQILASAGVLNQEQSQLPAPDTADARALPSMQLRNSLYSQCRTFSGSNACARIRALLAGVAGKRELLSNRPGFTPKMRWLVIHS